MNKKFSTLMVSALLLAGSFPAIAQDLHTGQGEIPYRSQVVKSASLDAGLFGVKKIEASKYYQLVVNSKSLEANEQTYVLTMERDYRTGHLYLAAKPIQEAKLTHSLWQITPDPKFVNGRKFIFTNRETGYPITFDPNNAAELNGLTGIKSDANVPAIKYYDAAEGVEPTVLNGCQDDWAWYTSFEQSTDFDNEFVYSYYHKDAKMIMALSLVKHDATPDDPYMMDGYYVQAVKETQDKFGTFGVGSNNPNIENLISLRPVIAGAKVLNANEINSMIDSDGSYLKFSGATGYTNENQGTSAKFTVFKPGSTTETVSLAIDPFSGAYAAQTSPFASLGREQYDFQVNTIAAIGATTPNVYAGYNILFNSVAEPTKYLTVSHDLYEDVQIGNYNAQIVQPEVQAVPVTGEMTKEIARYHWKVTYFASNDSVVLEPLNASRDTYEGVTTPSTDAPVNYYNTINKGTAFATGAAAENNAYNKAAGVPVALFVQNFGLVGDANKYLTIAEPDKINREDAKYAAAPKFDGTVIPYTENVKEEVAGNNPAYVANATSYKTLYTATKAIDAVDAEITFDGVNINTAVDYMPYMNLRLGFAPEYTYLARGSKVDGIYFVRLATSKAVTQGEKRVNNSYIVSDFAGHMYYDVKENEQEFNHMPATQWVVKQLGCLDKTEATQLNETPRVRISNREFANVAFEGQLYNVKDAEGNVVADRYYFIDHFTKPYVKGLKGHGNEFDFFSCGDTIYFEDTKNITRGYLDLSGKQITDTTYVFNLIDGLSNEMFLTADMNDTLTISKTALEFQLDNVKKVTANGWEKNIYNLKIKDANQIDNDYKYIALDQNHKFVAKYKQDIDKDPTLTMAWFAFKEDAHTGTHYYAMILTDKDGNALKVLRRQPISNEMKIDDLCTSQGTTTTTIFDIKNVKSHIYVQLPAEKVFVPVTIQKEPYQAFLYEDFSSAYSIGKGMGFVGVQPKNVSPKAPSVYVDLAKDDKYRPLYLFVVNPDSVPAYKFCKDGTIEAPHGLNPSCGHEESYEGYLAGRFMINLQDSVDNNINKIENANKFKHNNKTRLAFVEAFHKGNMLYILKDNYTLEMQPWDKAGSKTVIAIKQNGHNYINPKYLANNDAFKAVIDVTKEDELNRAGFALRRVGFENDATALENQFYLETAVTGYGAFKGENAAWLKEEDGVAVLAQKANVNGNHDGDEVEINEGINQATPFTFDFENATAPTENEDMSTSSVSVIAGNGVVTIKGAAGKTVAITNVLGQSLVNTTVTSDNATISVSTGLIFVTVEGEAAVKAIVK